MFAVPVLTQPAALVTVTEYVPFNAVVELGKEGFCVPEAKPPGPVHAYVDPPPDDKLAVAPVQTVLPLTVIAGAVLIVTGVVTVAVQLFALVAVTVYMPLAAAVTFVMDGFCEAELNPLGPLQL